VVKDEEIGAKWIATAAREGNPIAANRLAHILFAGRGMTADPIEAAKWHLIAQKGGKTDPDLDALAAKLSDADRKEAKSRADAFKPEE
jgi:TPR repeat protein